ncbi:MAG: hypothetical protein ABIQ05_08600 [Candidatus Limnocylindria bacterium]
MNPISRRLHPILYRWTGGARLLGRSLGNLTILLTTVGRRSGRPRVPHRKDRRLSVFGRQLRVSRVVGQGWLAAEVAGLRTLAHASVVWLDVGVSLRADA